MARWTNTTEYPELAANQVSASDLVPIASMTEADGERQRVMTVETARAALAGIATINTHAGNHTLSENTDLGAYVRITGEGTVTLPTSFVTGWQCTIVNATDSNPVDLSTGGSLLLPASVTEFIQNRRAVLVVHIGSGNWEVHGALEDAGS
jgi:hypothetical protein